MKTHQVLGQPKRPTYAPYAYIALLVWILLQVTIATWIATESIRAICLNGVSFWPILGLLIVAVWLLRQVPTK